MKLLVTQAANVTTGTGEMMVAPQTNLPSLNKAAECGNWPGLASWPPMIRLWSVVLLDGDLGGYSSVAVAKARRVERRESFIVVMDVK